MKRKWMKFILTGVFVAGLVGSSYATSFADVKLDGELRVRGVLVDNIDGHKICKTCNIDGGFFEQRTRLNATASVDENVKVFIQAQDSRMWGSEANTTTTGNGVQGLDLGQGYLELGNLFGASQLSVKIGRQGMAYGEHRLIGTLEWSNNARRFDAIKFMFKNDIVDIDLWTAKVSESGADWGNDSNFNGLYTSFKKVRNHEIDVYLLQKIVGSADVDLITPGLQTNSNFYTLGGRIKGDIGDNFKFDYAVELASQFGDSTKSKTKTISKNAGAFAARVGFTIPNALGLRLGAELDGASGDDVATADKDEAFDNLYPTNHYLYGFTDDVNWTNMSGLNFNASIKPIDKLKLSVEAWMYTLLDKLAPEDSSSIDDNGSEINGKLNYEISKKINLETAYAIRYAGDLKDKPETTATIEGANSYGGYGAIPADKSATLAYFMINVKFN